MQKSIFEDQEVEVVEQSNVEQANEMSLIIKSTEKKPLSKKQQSFNSLVVKIEKLKNNIIKEEERLERINKVYLETIRPLQEKFAYACLNLCEVLDRATKMYKFTKKEMENMQAVILDLFYKANEYVVLDEKRTELVEKWENIYNKKDNGFDMNGEHKTIFDFLNEVYNEGFLNNDDDDDESYENKNYFNKNYKEKKKTKKQIEKEQAKEEAEKLKNKNVRSIYISLAKVLHPDTETDDIEKQKKQELMQQLTNAYEQQDLTTLLKMEMEWIYKASEHLEKVADEKLDIYIEVLKEQERQLTTQKWMLNRNPTYQYIFDYSRMNDKRVDYVIIQDKSILLNQIREANMLFEEFDNAKSKKVITEFLKQEVKILRDDDPFFW